MLVFKLNSNVTRDQGSVLMRFFGRDVGTYLPTLVRKRFDRAAFIQKRSEHQLKVAKKLGRRSVDQFKTGDMVVAQNIRTGKWTIRGKVSKARTAEDGMSRSFVIETEAGKTTLRNGRHLRHQGRIRAPAWCDLIITIAMIIVLVTIICRDDTLLPTPPHDINHLHHYDRHYIHCKTQSSSLAPHDARHSLQGG